MKTKSIRLDNYFELVNPKYVNVVKTVDKISTVFNIYFIII